MAFDLDKLVRPNIRSLVPYSCARTEHTGVAQIYLDANENSFGSPDFENYSRYPDPQQARLKSAIAELVDVETGNIFVGNGSDEAIDLLIRIFCRPTTDNIIVCPPTYGMYAVSASVNDVAVRSVPLTEDFGLDSRAVTDAVGRNTKLIFVCSPNNPTGNLIDRRSIIELANETHAIVVVDEAYINFAGEESLVSEVTAHANLVVLQTFSKAWGLAALRVGVALADTAIIDLLGRVKPPYNVSRTSQTNALRAINSRSRMGKNVARIIRERVRLSRSLEGIECVQMVYPSEANFLLVKFNDARAIYQELIARGIVVRDRSALKHCEGCLRITVGTPEENRSLIEALRSL